MRKTLLSIGAVVATCVVAVTIYNLDAITGQWKFDRMCKAEGGSRFHAVVEKNVGWDVESHDTYGYQWPFLFDHVAFVRYEDKQGVQFDVLAGPYVAAFQRKYTFSPVDASRQVRYRFRYEHTRLPDDDRFTKTQYQVLDLTSRKVVASHTAFGYQWTKPERVILEAPTGVGCWNQQADIDKFFQSVYSSGSNK